MATASLAQSWDWEPSARSIAQADACDAEAQALHEPVVSPDGQRLARVADLGEGYALCVNGEVLGETYDKLWYPRFTPDNRITVLASDGAQWLLVVDDEAGEGFDYAWNPLFSADGRHIALAIQSDGRYGMALDGEAWETLYENANNFALSSCGRFAAAAVQAEALAQADIAAFKRGVFAVAVNGETWPGRYMNVFSLAFSPDGGSLAAEVRVTPKEFTILENKTLWPATFAATWAPAVNPASGSAVAPVRTAGLWTLAQGGKAIWSRSFPQCFTPFFSPDGGRTAAVVSPEFGRWTLAVDGTPQRTSFGDMACSGTFCPQGRRTAYLGKDQGKWAVVVDDTPWPGRYDMAWAPVFSPDGAHCAAKLERGGKYTVAVDGREFGGGGEYVADPVFSPDSSKVLIVSIENGSCVRRVVPVARFAD